MKTLTEMLDNALNDSPPESEPEKEANFYEIECIKKVFREWLKGIHVGGLTEQTLFVVESTRKLLITLVDEP